MATTVKSRMPKIKASAQETKEEAKQAKKGNNKRANLIKALMIVGTFAAIVALSIVTQGRGDTRPSGGVIVWRIILLSFWTILYFLMLYHTRATRKNNGQKPPKK